jgi:hypothetical protein
LVGPLAIVVTGLRFLGLVVRDEFTIASQFAFLFSAFFVNLSVIPWLFLWPAPRSLRMAEFVCLKYRAAIEPKID